MALCEDNQDRRGLGISMELLWEQPAGREGEEPTPSSTVEDHEHGPAAGS